MLKNVAKSPKNSSIPLYMNGLYGRMLHIPAKKDNNSRQILLLYGRRANLERYSLLAEQLSEYGNVTMPDLPGFGGMESFYKIGEKPSLDNLADYLAAFIKLRFKKRRITIIGISMGFVVATRMLQRYPDIAKKVDLVISMVGFTRKDDFMYSRSRSLAYQAVTWVCSQGVVAWLAQKVMLRPTPLRLHYALLGRRDRLYKNLPRHERKARLSNEIKLWRINDFRTYALTTNAALKLDLTHKQLPLPVYHLAVEQDTLLDNAIVEQHMRIVYKDYAVHYLPKVGYYYEQEIPDLRGFIRGALAGSGL